MDPLKDTSVKQAYLQALADEDRIDKYKKISLQNEDQPLYSPVQFIEEEEISYDAINEAVLESSFDILNLDLNMINMAGEYTNLLENMNLRIGSIQDKLDAEEERVRDINMICGNVTDVNTIIPLNASMFNGNLYQYRNVITSSVASEHKREIELINVNGNGYEGCKYAYNGNDAALEEVLDTSNHDYLLNQYANQYWEYSRLFSYDQNNRSDIVNIDDRPALVQLTFRCNNDNGINELVLDTDEQLHLTMVEISEDAVNWTATQKGDWLINNANNTYSDFNYIYGSGAIIFPVTRYVRITVYNHTVDTKSKIKVNDAVLNDVYRKVVRINQIQGRRMVFIKGIGTSENIIQVGQALCAGIFDNEYIPQFLANNLTDEIRYRLIVNGESIEVVPINSNKDGVKYIKYSKTPLKEKYVYYIKEPIKSLQVSISIPVALQYSPYIANLKLCLGKQAANV